MKRNLPSYLAGTSSGQNGKCVKKKKVRNTKEKRKFERAAWKHCVPLLSTLRYYHSSLRQHIQQYNTVPTVFISFFGTRLTSQTHHRRTALHRSVLTHTHTALFIFISHSLIVQDNNIFCGPIFCATDERNTKGPSDGNCEKICFICIHFFVQN